MSVNENPILPKENGVVFAFYPDNLVTCNRTDKKGWLTQWSGESGT
ncbi:MAG: hypothetical protein PHQ40_07480 [Anaerolineaceae bacterium]|nr:hypothetical protein [Anaerolineaceae bacterium]